MSTMAKQTRTLAARATAGPGPRMFEVIASNGAVDREQDRIDPRGWELDDFRRAGPHGGPFLWAHDYSRPPIGRVPRIAVEGDVLKAVVEFPPAGLSDFADEIERLYRAGYLNAVSVGFQPLEWTHDKQRGGINFLRQSLLELSAVPVPANPGALVTQRVNAEALRKWFGGGRELPARPLTMADLRVGERALGFSDLTAALRPGPAPASPFLRAPTRREFAVALARVVGDETRGVIQRMRGRAD